MPHVSSTGQDQTEEQRADLVKTNLGIIAGVAFFSFGLAILFGGPLVDLLGMGSAAQGRGLVPYRRRRDDDLCA